ncbi:pyridoxal phosphate-dependent aminotransferase [Gluconobacter kanchanaburiensis]|uniref:Aminotransferase n=1 Tax=Gluconobacter kanchanaburiensis NBRC 103587 TaxID=1307948 RepID=A0A511BA89_9PROT|nr:pyridoxal phosphate-dependent aminotransferase [Gluconobacter kanchanaburiensis]MBF0862521.1 pyridoxal phosphate-dependent aminotransferase [Gluconobacter kanchanaburiensis]GEK96642.1 aminotransferase [Gluconobacter kanchanaburiensis NBRC 103587]
MTMSLSSAARSDLLVRGYSRRSFGRIATLLAAGATVQAMTRSAKAAILPSGINFAGMTRLGSNECWTGPFPEAARAGAAAVFESNRYDPTGHMRDDLVRTAADVEQVPQTHIMPWCGSSDPLARAIVTFCSPERGLVTADPSYEAGWVASEWLKLPLAKVPLSAKNHYRTDVRAMLAADPNAGVYYICSPNNPTGTLTPLRDIAWLVEHKPAGSVVLVDEAYIHFSNAPSAVELVRQNKDVIVLRTFSKMFAMAGMRLGLTFARPDLHERMMRYDGRNETQMLPVPAMACGTMSLTMKSAIDARREEMIAARTMTFRHLRARGIHFIPSDANMFVIDWKKPAAPIKDAFLKQNIVIGRSWPIWPNASRISVGSMDEMKTFCTVLDRVTG